MTDQFSPADQSVAFHESFIGPPLQELPFGADSQVQTPAAGRPITTMILTNEICKWPFGDPTEADFYYCGQPSQTARSYCHAHESLSRPPGQHRKR